MDLWEDIVVEKEMVYFSNPKRLYKFLVLRMLEWLELLRNPASRPLDILIYKEAAKAYQKGLLNKENLLTMKDSDLFRILEDEGAIDVDFVKTHDD